MIYHQMFNLLSKFQKMENFDINNIKISDKDYNEIMDLKVNSNLLINMLFKLKGENIKLINNVQQITTECNKELRTLKEEIKNNNNNNTININNNFNINNNINDNNNIKQNFNFNDDNTNDIKNDNFNDNINNQNDKLQLIEYYYLFKI